MDHRGSTIFFYSPSLFSNFLYTPSSFKTCFVKTLLTRVQLVEISGLFLWFQNFCWNFPKFQPNLPNFTLKIHTLKIQKNHKLLWPGGKNLPPNRNTARDLKERLIANKSATFDVKFWNFSMIKKIKKCDNRRESPILPSLGYLRGSLATSKTKLLPKALGYDHGQNYLKPPTLVPWRNFQELNKGLLVQI